MPRQNYQSQLEDLRSAVCSMGDLVGDRYEQAIEAYESGDEAIARQVIEGDQDVNERYLDLENDCVDLIALQQPVAGDLRFVVASFKIITDLERVADLATNLAAYGRDAGGIDLDPEIESIATAGGEMLEASIAAYREADTASAFEVAARDDELDAACEAASDRVVRGLVRQGSRTVDGELEAIVAEASTTLLTIRDLERVGDHAVNIAARTVYMTDSDDTLLY